MTYNRLSTCLLGFILSAGLLFFQPLRAQYNFSEFEAALTARQKLIGKDAVVLIWKGDSMIYKKEMGEFNSKTQAPIASCSKWLTAALVLILADEGKLSLDDPVVKYLPIFERYGKNYITIRHCLSQMTGIEDEGNLFKKLLQRKKISSLEEEVNAFAAREIRANPGEGFWYGNIGLNIAGRVAEIVSKKKFDMLIKQKLFNPLGMKKTSFSNPEGGAINPSGGAQSTADDYMRFLAMILNKGKYKGQQLLSEKAINDLMTIQTTTPKIKYAPKAAEGFNYALGSWVLEEKNGKASVLFSPGLFGTWPLVDFSRGYAYLFFVKNFLGEQRADAQIELKKILDKELSD
jgi:CubicO group peptidase (beta-lactamase class C family)